jgi:hypothetical protein
VHDRSCISIPRNSTKVPLFPLWCAKIPSGPHLTELLALISSPSLPYEVQEISPADRKHLSTCQPDYPTVRLFLCRCAILTAAGQARLNKATFAPYPAKAFPTLLGLTFC